jgi:hypothetical protein
MHAVLPDDIVDIVWKAIARKIPAIKFGAPPRTPPLLQVSASIKSLITS